MCGNWETSVSVCCGAVCVDGGVRETGAWNGACGSCTWKPAWKPAWNTAWKAARSGTSKAAGRRQYGNESPLDGLQTFQMMLLIIDLMPWRNSYEHAAMNCVVEKHGAVRAAVPATSFISRQFIAAPQPCTENNPQPPRNLSVAPDSPRGLFRNDGGLELRAGVSSRWITTLDAQIQS